MRLQQMEVSCETKTKDNVFVLIRVAVQYQVNDDEESIKNAHYRLTNPKQQIESYGSMSCARRCLRSIWTTSSRPRRRS